MARAGQPARVAGAPCGGECHPCAMLYWSYAYAVLRFSAYLLIRNSAKGSPSPAAERAANKDATT